jgi:hypothetical protein
MAVSCWEEIQCHLSLAIRQLVIMDLMISG